MTGMRLRSKDALKHDGQVSLYVYVPMDQREAYSGQTPQKIDAAVRWASRTGGYEQMGVEYRPMTREQQQILESCFAYFD